VQKPNKVIKHRNLPLLLLQAREKLFTEFRPLLNDAGVTEQQWRVIRALLELGPMEPRHIGEHLLSVESESGGHSGAHG